MSEQSEDKTLDENVRFFGKFRDDVDAKATREYQNEQIDRALRALLVMAEESTLGQVRVEAATVILRFHSLRNGKKWED